MELACSDADSVEFRELPRRNSCCDAASQRSDSGRLAAKTPEVRNRTSDAPRPVILDLRPFAMTPPLRGSPWRAVSRRARDRRRHRALPPTGPVGPGSRKLPVIAQTRIRRSAHAAASARVARACDEARWIAEPKGSRSSSLTVGVARAEVSGLGERSNPTSPRFRPGPS